MHLLPGPDRATILVARDPARAWHTNAARARVDAGVVVLKESLRHLVELLAEGMPLHREREGEVCRLMRVARDVEEASWLGRRPKVG